MDTFYLKKNQKIRMSFGQNFAYSKTKEQDIAYMLAANVRHFLNLANLFAGSRWH